MGGRLERFTIWCDGFRSWESALAGQKTIFAPQKSVIRSKTFDFRLQRRGRLLHHRLHQHRIAEIQMILHVGPVTKFHLDRQCMFAPQINGRYQPRIIGM